MKRKAALFFAVFLCALALTACTPARTVDAMKPNITITFSYQDGLKYPPSFAAWLEDETGYHATVYATKKVADNWKREKWAQVLPIWFGVKEKNVDAITEATPENNAMIQFNIPEEFAGKKFTLYLEANASYDYNNYYREGLEEGMVGYSYHNGQPSMLWSLEIDPANGKVREETMKLAGAGELMGASHVVYDDLTNVTTAKKLLTDITVKYDFVK